MGQGINRSAVKRPKWTGGQGDLAVLVSRGEPSRTDAQMADAVRGQVVDYLATWPPMTPGRFVLSPELVAAVADRLIAEHVRPGKVGVMVWRESLLLYVGIEIGRRTAAP